MSDDIGNEDDGRAAGREAAQVLRAGLAAGTPREDILEIWPKPAHGFRSLARRMIESDEPRRQKSGKWWAAYVDGFETEWPNHEEFA
jgi:hypothetical protein